MITHCLSMLMCEPFLFELIHTVIFAHNIFKIFVCLSFVCGLITHSVSAYLINKKFLKHSYLIFDVVSSMIAISNQVYLAV